VRDYFFVALAVQLAGDSDLDTVDRNLRERVAATLWRRVFPDDTKPPAPVSLFNWTRSLADGSAQVLQQPEPVPAIRADWTANRRRYLL
jgi:hypothetical protein